MAVLKLIFILIIGNFIENVMLVYNPMLTYTLRFKNVSIHPSDMGNFTINQYRETQYINGYLTVPLNPQTDRVIAIFYRCDPDGINCEYYQTWTMTDICPKLKEKNQVWSRWYGSFSPPLVCPFDKVHYQMTNGTVDIGAFILLYPRATEYQWRIIQKFYGNDIHISSMVIEGSLFSYRKRIKSIIKF